MIMTPVHTTIPHSLHNKSGHFSLAQNIKTTCDFADIVNIQLIGNESEEIYVKHIIIETKIITCFILY